MPKEIFLQIIDKGLYLPLALVLVTYFLRWTTVLFLSFQLLGIKPNIKRVIIWTTVEIFYCLLGKQFLPGVFFGFGLVFLETFIIVNIGRVSILKAFLTAIVAEFFCGIGVIILQSPLCALFNESLVKFILETPLGSAVGTIFEMIFPAIAFFTFRALSISPIASFKKKSTKLEVFGIILFGFLFFIIYNSVAIIFIVFRSLNKPDLIMNLIYQWIAELGMGLAFYAFFSLNQKQREIERLKYKQKLEEEKTELEGKLVTEKAELVGEFEKERALLLEKIQQLDALNKGLQDTKLKPRELMDTFKKSLLEMQDIGFSIYGLISPGPDQELLSKFSQEELRIMKLVAKGKTNKEISEVLYKSEGTIANTVSGILEKAGVADRTQLAVYAVSNHLVELD